MTCTVRQKCSLRPLIRTTRKNKVYLFLIKNDTISVLNNYVALILSAFAVLAIFHWLAVKEKLLKAVQGKD